MNKDNASLKHAFAMSHACQILGETIGLYKYNYATKAFLDNYILLNYIPNTWDLITTP